MRTIRIIIGIFHIQRMELRTGQCALFVFDNRIEIVSPGHLPNNLTVEKIKAGNSNIRNPILVSYAAKGLLPYHGLGSGTTRALRCWPHIDFVDDHENCLFTAVIHRVPMSSQKMSVKMSEEMSEEMSEIILTILQSDPQRTASQLATALGVTRRTIERAIAALRKEGRMRRIGPTKGGRWEVLS